MALSSTYVASLGLWLLAAPFLVSGLSKTLDFHSATMEMRAAKLRPPTLMALLVIAIQLGGGLMLVFDVGRIPAAVVLAGFTLAASMIGHRFWKHPRGIKRAHHLNAFLANVGLIGGLVTVVGLAVPAHGL